MNIAVAADGNSMESKVSMEFENCLYLLIVNMDDSSIKAVKNNALEILPENNLADVILKHDCEALITGKIKASAFNILADSYVTRYDGAGSSVKKALEAMDKNLLPIIKNYDGAKQGCGGHHH